MQTPKKKAFEVSAQTLIKNLEKRNMEGMYFSTSKDCVEYISSLIPDNSSISWGGGETLSESGLKKKLLEERNLNFIDRMAASTPKEKREIYSKMVLADYFFMSSNAVTLDGELVNIDGNGNRLACLMQGPQHVFLLVGMNKIVRDVEAAFKRIRVHACPPNVLRLNRNTPCAKTGICADCHSPDCICCHSLVTRHSFHKGRIKVFFIGEELGY